jgi:GTPase
VKKETMTADTYAKELRSRAPSLRHVPVLFSSALTGQRVQKVLEMIQQVAAERSKRIPTREVTLRIRKLAERQPPPHFRGNVVKLQYATQVAVKPPIFVIFSNHPKAIPDHYVRYLLNGIRESWAFHGTPIRIRFRGRKDRKKEGELT